MFKFCEPNKGIVEIKEEKFIQPTSKKRGVASQCGWQRKETKEGDCQKMNFKK
jgi:hypothetical protein